MVTASAVSVVGPAMVASVPGARHVHSVSGRQADYGAWE
jgi:hypothetical protein